MMRKMLPVAVAVAFAAGVMAQVPAPAPRPASSAGLVSALFEPSRQANGHPTLTGLQARAVVTAIGP